MLRGIGLGTIWAERLEVGYTSPTLRSFIAGRTTLVTHYTWGRSHHGKSSSARLGASLIRGCTFKRFIDLRDGINDTRKFLIREKGQKIGLKMFCRNRHFLT
jgi:hypothetical protein